MTKNDIIGLKFRIVSGTNLQETDRFLQFVNQSFYLSVKLGTDRVLGRNSERASECGPQVFLAPACLPSTNQLICGSQLNQPFILQNSFVWIMCVIMIPKIALLIR